MSHLAVTYRLDPTPQQEAWLLSTAAACRAVWNAAIEQRQAAWRRQRKYVGFAEQCRGVTEARAAIPFLAKAPVDALHAVLRDLERAYRNWWDGRARFPNWKSAKRCAPSFRVKAGNRTGFRMMASRAHVRLPKIGPVKAYISRDLPGRPLSATVARRAGRWYMSIICEVPAPTPTPHMGDVVGVDVGIANTLTLSNGEQWSMPCPTVQDWQRLARWQRRAARRTPGSRAYKKARRAVARWHERHGNRRTDFIAKSVHELATTYSGIAIEDLAVGRMTRRAHGRGRAAKAGLNRALLLRAFGTFRRRLEHKAPWTGSIVVAVDPRHTSQTCHCCGHVASENRESQAVFRCVACGYEAHADVNAAQNILSRARAGHARINAEGVGGLVSPTSNSEPYATSTEASHV